MPLTSSIDRSISCFKEFSIRHSEGIEENGNHGRWSSSPVVFSPCRPLSRHRRRPRHAGPRRRPHPALHIQCDDGYGDAAVRDEEYPHGERAVPGAEARRARGRPPRGERPQQHQQQRHLPLARRPSDSERVGGRAVVHHAVPDPAGAELHVPVPDHRAARHAVVARALLLAPRHALRPPRHPPAARRRLPVPQALQRGASPVRRVVQRRPGGGDQAGTANRRRAERLRRLHLQRPARADLQLLGHRRVQAAGEAGTDVHAAAHQRGAQQRALLRRRQPHAHRGAGGRQLREAVHGHHGGHLPRADHGRSPHRRRHPAFLPGLRHGHRAVHQHRRHVRQHHRHRRARVRAAARRRAPRHSGARPPDVQRHGRRDQLLGQLPEPRERGVPGARAPHSRPQILLRRGAGHRPVPWPPERNDVPGPERHGPVRGVHEQRLLRHAPDDVAAAGALPAAVRRRAQGRLPGGAGEAVQLHGPAAERHVREPRHKGGAARVQRHRRGGAAGHQHTGGREPPAPPPRLRLLRRRPRVRELRREQGPRKVQPRRPRAAEHHQRAHRRMGRHTIRRRQPRCVDHALPLRRALELGPVHGVARQRRAAAEPEAAPAAVRHPQMLIPSAAVLSRAMHAFANGSSFCGGQGTHSILWPLEYPFCWRSVSGTKTRWMCKKFAGWWSCCCVIYSFDSNFCFQLNIRC